MITLFDLHAFFISIQASLVSNEYAFFTITKHSCFQFIRFQQECFLCLILWVQCPMFLSLLKVNVFEISSWLKRRKVLVYFSVRQVQVPTCTRAMALPNTHTLREAAFLMVQEFGMKINPQKSKPLVKVLMIWFCIRPRNQNKRQRIFWRCGISLLYGIMERVRLKEVERWMQN